MNPTRANDFLVTNPATEQTIATISLGSKDDVERAVLAARNAFETFSYTSKEQRIKLLERLLEAYNDRYNEMAEAISNEMGAPIDFSKSNQTACGNGHISAAIDALKNYVFEENRGNSIISKEPIGVCGFITPWNWPINQVACKVTPALATGCTVVIKPSEIAPLSAYLFAEMIDEAGYPEGVFNLVNGDGQGVGSAISSHPDIDMVSFTGSTQAGIAVAKAAADTVKRVTQELGGKSPNIILEDADIEESIKLAIDMCFKNTGQSCNAPTRVIIPQRYYKDAVDFAKKASADILLGDPSQPGSHLGPVVSEIHYDRIQKLIQIGIDEGASLITGGTGKPEGFETGYYVKPTIFADVNNDMTIAREEIFGPVLCMIPYKNEEEAIRIANDTPYGLAAHISGEVEHAKHVARRIKAGMIDINGEGQGFSCPFGGFKQSGNGREWGDFGFEDFLETKVITC